MEKIAVIGAGVVGGAIVKSLLKRVTRTGLSPPGEIWKNSESSRSLELM